MATENKIIKDDPNEFKSQPKDISKLAKLYDSVSILARSMEEDWRSTTEIKDSRILLHSIRSDRTYIYMYTVNWNYKNYEKKSYSSIRLRTRGRKMIILTICIYQSFSSRLITVQTSLLQTIVALISPSARYNIFWRTFHITFTQWRHILSRNYVNILREIPNTVFTNIMFPDNVYENADWLILKLFLQCILKGISLVVVNSLREMQTTLELRFKYPPGHPISKKIKQAGCQLMYQIKEKRMFLIYFLLLNKRY